MIAEGADRACRGNQQICAPHIAPAANVLRDLSAAENDEREAYPPFSAIEQRHAEIREAFGRAQDGVPDPHPPPIEQPKL